jgi:glycosyltransferase involved in cell wall biosynthesis
MRFSLVVATVGRTAELRRLLKSLGRQQHRDFEVLVVDQNPDERLLPVLAEFEGRLEIRRLVSPLGLSRSRNFGLRHVTGDVIGFPDDDCWYPDDLLMQAKMLLQANPGWQGIIGDAVDEAGNRILPWRDRMGRLTRPMSWRRAVTYVYFLRSQALRRIGGFDEGLGPGSDQPWGCGEDNDLMLRVLEAGLYVQYDPKIRICHPRMFLSFDEMSREKRYRYSLGEGYLLRKHPMPLWWKLLFFAVPGCRAIAALGKRNRGEGRFHWMTLAGRIKGFSQGKVNAGNGNLPPAALDSPEIGPVHPADAPESVKRTE